MCKMVLEHWNMLAECVVRNLPSADLIRRTWAASYSSDAVLIHGFGVSGA